MITALLFTLGIALGAVNLAVGFFIARAIYRPQTLLRSPTSASKPSMVERASHRIHEAIDASDTRASAQIISPHKRASASLVELEAQM